MCGRPSDKISLLCSVVCHLGILVSIKACQFLGSSVYQKGKLLTCLLQAFNFFELHSIFLFHSSKITTLQHEFSG